MNNSAPINILIAGVGGQGNLLASRLLAAVAIPEGFQITIGETKGVSQRSGSVTSHVRLCRSVLGPLIPLQAAHIILGLEPLETLRLSRKYSNSETSVLVNPNPMVPMLVAQGLQSYPPLERILSELGTLNKAVHLIRATELARDAGNQIAQNVVMLGALSGLELLPFGRDRFLEVIIGSVSEKHRGLNERAFEAGYEEGARQRDGGRKEGGHA